jgi:hypothetical protein
VPSFIVVGKLSFLHLLFVCLSVRISSVWLIMLERVSFNHYIPKLISVYSV